MIVLVIKGDNYIAYNNRNWQIVVKSIKESNKLTEREKEIFDFLSKGLKLKDISNLLCISEHTVKAHKDSIYRKLDVHNRIQLILVALKKEKEK